ncbi:MAG: hypothetical protein EXQ91_09010 [Alphaproteobacteria bacterium]|nr:hypothetical protein [Alphaproteobacteria bacterium]
MARFRILPKLKRPVEHYVRDHIFFGILADPQAMQLRDAIGVDQLMWGSDFSHHGGQSLATRAKLTAYLGDALGDVQQKIAAGNVTKLYDIRP